MIIAIEGCDGAGKTTVVTHLSRLLPSAMIIQFRQTPPMYLKAVDVLEPFFFSLFEQMYNPYTVYVCDRFFSVSSRVYAEINKMPFTLDGLDTWVMPELHVILLDTQPKLLLERFEQEEDRPVDEAYFQNLRTLYFKVCQNLSVASYQRVDTEPGIGHTVSVVTQLCRALIREHNVYRKTNQ